jgi:hypothetical protein
VLIAGCTTVVAEPAPTASPSPTPETGTAFNLFASHLVEAFTDYLEVNEVIPPPSKPKAWTQWVTKLRDWADDEIAYLTTHDLSPAIGRCGRCTTAWLV